MRKGGRQMSGALRLTVARAYRRGSEILVHDSGPTLDLSDALLIATEIRRLVEKHGAEIDSSNIGLVVRVEHRDFADAVGRPAPRRAIALDSAPSIATDNPTPTRRTSTRF
jgi:hypothetical protein